MVAGEAAIDSDLLNQVKAPHLVVNSSFFDFASRDQLSSATKIAFSTRVQF